MELPRTFDEKIRKLLQTDYDNYMSAFKTEYGQTLRVNRLKIDPADFIRRFPLSHELTGKVAWCENGYYYQGEERLSMHPWYYAGVYYLQEPSAMAPASFLPVEPGDKVLDLCAAPGGKTTALAAKLGGEGLLVANDISASRCKALVKNVEMAGIRNVIVTCENPENLAKHFPNVFDKILIDAPCSGEGMFRKDPSMMAHWSQEEVERYHEIQKNLLTLAASMLKPGGRMMYSTCTYSPEEDEDSVAYLLDSHPDMTLEELPIYEGVDEGHPQWCSLEADQNREELHRCRRFWNHRVNGEGQFMALFVKSEAEETGRKIKNWKYKKMDIPEEMAGFLKLISWSADINRCYLVEDRIFLLPEEVPDLKGLRLMRSGLHLGYIKKKRFEPSQALAMALNPDEYKNVLNLDSSDIRTEKYLRCETIDGECADGWVLICTDGYPLGWGKARNGRIKNKYAPAWRKQ